VSRWLKFHFPAVPALAAALLLYASAGSSAAATITDHADRTVRFEKPFVRIVSLYGAHTENLVMLGLDKEIIGISSSDRNMGRLASRPVFSYHDDPEKFIAARPDLVLIRPMIDRGYPALIAKLEKNRITVVSLQPGTVAAMFTYWEVLGILTGRKRQARQMAVDFKAAVARFRAITRDLPQKKNVYFEAIHSRMKTFTPDSMAAYVLDTAGGINIAADALQVRTTNIAFYGKERLISKAAEIDVYIAQIGAMNQPTIARIKAEPGYQVIKAVKNNEIYLVDEQIVSRPTMRLLCGIAHTGQILYPELYKDQARDILSSVARVQCQF
jgi:iron complex transport system substrate-binding protein